MQCRTVESGDMTMTKPIGLKKAWNGEDAVYLASSWVIGKVNFAEWKGVNSETKVSDVEVKVKRDRTK